VHLAYGLLIHILIREFHDLFHSNILIPLKAIKSIGLLLKILWRYIETEGTLLLFVVIPSTMFIGTEYAACFS
jgi:hypothetical protein